VGYHRAGSATLSITTDPKVHDHLHPVTVSGRGPWYPTQAKVRLEWGTQSLRSGEPALSELEGDLLFLFLELSRPLQPRTTLAAI